MKIPHFLKKNDTVTVVAPAYAFDRDLLQQGVVLLESWGLKVKLGEHLFDQFHAFAAIDEDRLADLQWALDEPEVKAVFCARGGYGVSRIIDGLDFSTFRKKPKWLIGFSDITVLHCDLAGQHIASVHSIMPASFAKPGHEESVQKLKDLLFGKTLEYKLPTHTLSRPGVAQAVLVGGNLSILQSLLSTPSELQTRGKILFLEDVGESLYRIDRMIVQLKRAGKFKGLAGLILGHFSEVSDGKVPFGKANAYEVIIEHLEEYSFPIAVGFPAGHEALNMPLILGQMAQLSVTPRSTELLF